MSSWSDHAHGGGDSDAFAPQPNQPLYDSDDTFDDGVDDLDFEPYLDQTSGGPFEASPTLPPPLSQQNVMGQHFGAPSDPDQTRVFPTSDNFHPPSSSHGVPPPVHQENMLRPNNPELISDALSGSTSTSSSTPEHSSVNSSPPASAWKYNNGGLKRHRDSHSTIQPPSKAMRPSPSPQTTRSTTPASNSASTDSEDLEMPADVDWKVWLGSDPTGEAKNMAKDRRRIEKEAREREERERLDEQFAKQLQEEMYQEAGFQSGGNAPLSSPRSNAGSPSAYQSQIRFVMPPSTGPSAGSSRNPFQPSPFATPSMPVKKEINPMFSRQNGYMQQSPAKQTIKSSFVDSNDSSDSDLLITDGSSFVPSSRSNQKNRSFNTQGPVSAHRLGYNQGIQSQNSYASTLNPITSQEPVLIDQSSSDDSSILDLTEDMPGSFPPGDPYNPPGGFRGQPGSSAYGGPSDPSILQQASGAITNAMSAASDRISQWKGLSLPTPSIYNSHHPSRSHIGTGTSFPGFYRPQGHQIFGKSYNYYDLTNDSSDDDGPSFHSTNTLEELRDLVNNVRPDEDLGASDRTGSPEDMAEGAALYEHQKLGLAWMIKMEEGTNKGGILADDMGLGKTIQAIALLVTRKSDDPNRKTTLIVAPVALLRQWEKEIEIKVKPDKQLSTYIYHGSKSKSVTWQHLKKHDVVITTYGMLAHEYKRKESIEIKKKANPNWVPTTPTDTCPLLGDQSRFYRIILDEAQNVKNKDTVSAKAVYQLDSLTRFCKCYPNPYSSCQYDFKTALPIRIKNQLS